MKRVSLSLSILSGTVFLASCVPQQPSGTSTMRGNRGMMGGNRLQATGFLPGQGQDITSFPDAKPSETIDVSDGETISLNPTIVRKTIHGSTSLATGGKEIAMYGYNGEIPGPLLRAKQGSTFTVNVTNDIDLPTTIHWHGIRLDNQFDGAAGLTQKEIAPGESFTYTVKVPDEGIYWYHTHVREDVQQPMGLYGAIEVTPLAKDAYQPMDLEQTLVLNDLLLDAEGSPVPYGRENADHTLMGRFGNTFLVNGAKPEPFEIGLGTVARFMVVNASNTRMYRIVPPPGGALKIVGGDNGRNEHE